MKLTVEEIVFEQWRVTDDRSCVSHPVQMGIYACGEQLNFQQILCPPSTFSLAVSLSQLQAG